MLSNIATPYLRKRAETLATKADIDEVVTQMRQTAKAVEGVKIDMQHQDWVARGWKTLRRVKLEELHSAVYDQEQWLLAEASSRSYGASKAFLADSLGKVRALSTLYFPELAPVILTVERFHSNAAFAL